jgi:hypothetical protein
MRKKRLSPMQSHFYSNLLDGSEIDCSRKNYMFMVSFHKGKEYYYRIDGHEQKAIEALERKGLIEKEGDRYVLKKD